MRTRIEPQESREGIAVVDGDGEHGHADLRAAVVRARNGLPPAASAAGARVGVVRRPTLGFVATLIACRGAGVGVTVLDEQAAPAAALLGLHAVLDPAGDRPDDPAAGDPDGVAGAAAPELGADWTAAHLDLGAADRVACLGGSGAWLASAVATAIGAGATLVLAPDPPPDPRRLAAWVGEHRITVLHTRPAALRAVLAFAAGPHLAALRCVAVENSGELLVHDIEALRAAAPSCHLLAGYRPSASGTPLAAWHVPPDRDLSEHLVRVPLGLPVASDLRLLGTGGREVAVGEVGEVHAGGAATGDLARRWWDGLVEFVPGVEAGADDATEAIVALRDVPGVSDALMAQDVAEDGAAVGVGFLLGAADQLDPERIRRSLSQRLPERAIPRLLVVVERLPLTPDGDYDLALLPRASTLVADPQEYVAPRTPLEQQLATIVKELLGAQRVGALDSFFGLGGFSLLATQLASRIREQMGVEVSLRDVFEAPTVESLAQLVLHRQLEQSDAGDLEALLSEIAGSGEPTA